MRWCLTRIHAIKPKCSVACRKDSWSVHLSIKSLNHAGKHQAIPLWNEVGGTASDGKAEMTGYSTILWAGSTDLIDKQYLNGKLKLRRIINVKSNRKPRDSARSTESIWIMTNPIFFGRENTIHDSIMLHHVGNFRHGHTNQVWEMDQST